MIGTSRIGASRDSTTFTTVPTIALAYFYITVGFACTVATTDNAVGSGAGGGKSFGYGGSGKEGCKKEDERRPHRLFGSGTAKIEKERKKRG